jgi:hypothetical protein
MLYAFGIVAVIVLVLLYAYLSMLDYKDKHARDYDQWE